MKHASLVLLFVMAACPPPAITEDPKDTDEPVLDTGDTGPEGDTGDTGDTVPDGPIFNLSWVLHEEVESLVYVTWEQEMADTMHVEFSFDEGEWSSTPSFEAEIGEQRQLVVGIPYELEASWRVVSERGESANGPTITTADVPDDLPLSSVEVADESAWLSAGKYLLTSINEQSGGWTGGTYWAFIVDRKGRPVWALETPDRHWTLFAQVAVTDDHLLIDEATYWSNWDSGAASTVHRRYLDLEIEELDTPGLHHAFVQLPDETLVWGSQNHGGHEALVERGPDDLDETILWTCQDNWPGSGWCESNGLFYVEETDSFLYSFYTNNSVVEVDRASGESLWWAGEVRNGYKFDPADSQFSWQHGISYTEAGTLLVSTESFQGPSTTLVREYQVDHADQTLDQVWSFDAGVHADTNGDAWRLDNGNTLHLLGSASHVKECDADGNVVWHLDFHSTKLLGRGQFIEDLYSLVSPPGSEPPTDDTGDPS